MMGRVREPACDIRPLAPDDVERVGRALGLARLHQGNGFYRVAWLSGAPVGHLHLALTDPPELQDVEVISAQRRRGVATELVTAAEDEVRARGHDLVRLEVSADDAAAQSLYRKCGYREAGIPPRRVNATIVVRTGRIRVDDTLVRWEKRLVR